MSIKLRTESKHDFEKDFYKLMNSGVFGKKRKDRDIMLIKTNMRRNQLESEPNYHKTTWFSESL